MERRGSHLARLGAVIGLATLAFGVRPLPAGAVMPTLTMPPERLYTLVDTPIAFTGPDAISGDDRELVVGVTDDSCAPSDGNDWSLDGCARVQMSVSHGQIAIPIATVLGGVGEPDGIASGGAIVDQSTDGDGTGLVVHINGTQDQLNDALAQLTYTPDSGYEYDGTNPEGLALTVVDGTTPADNVSHEVEIFVQQLNDGPTLTVPDQAMVAAGGTVSLPAVEPPVGTNGDSFVEDPDITDGEADDEMLTVMVATCGQFALRGGALTIGATIEDLLAGEGFPQLAIDAILAALPSEVTGQMFTTGSPTDWREGIAFIAEYDELNYALSQVDFQAPATDGTCDLFTIVTDLGNNGLPFQYVGSPIGGRDMPQPGFEIPDLGVDFGITSYVVGEGVELSVPATLTVAEGDTLAIPISTSSAMHPTVELDLATAGVTATGGGVDFTAPAVDQTFPENDAGPLDVDLPTVEDPDDEPDETLTVTVDLEGMPPGITLANDTVTITITDDDDPAPDTTKPTVTIDQAAGQADPTGTAPISFTVEFSEPVTGFTDTDVDLSASTAGGTLAAAVTGGPSTYTVTVTGMTTAGDVIAAIPADAATDAAMNTSEASTSQDNTVEWDPNAPDVTGPIATIDEAPGQDDPTDVSPITFRITFDEPVTGLEAADIDFGGSTVGGTLAAAITEIDASTYDVDVTGMTTAGDVRIYLPAGLVEDLAGNPSIGTLLVDDTVEWAPPPPDVTDPTVTVEQAVGQPDPTSLSPVEFTVEFSEPVFVFEETDLSFAGSTVGGTLSATITGSGPTYEVAVTGMTTDGDVVLSVPAAQVVDGAGNANTASTSQDNVVAWVAPDPGDVTAPTVTVEQADDQADPTSVAPVRFVATFSEPVTGFDVDDLRLDGSTVGGTILGEVQPQAKADGTSFDIVLTGMTTTGDIVLTVVAGAASDAAGNASVASSSADNVVRWVQPDRVDIDQLDDGIDGYTYDGYYGTSYGSDDGYLARTGTDLSVLLVIGVGVVGLGLGLVLVARRPWGRTG